MSAVDWYLLFGVDKKNIYYKDRSVFIGHIIKQIINSWEFERRNNIRIFIIFYRFYHILYKNLSHVLMLLLYYKKI